MRDRLLERARHSRSPIVLIGSLFRWATLSVAGVFALLGLLAGYALSLSLLVAALHDTIAPDRVGLWRAGDSLSLRLGFGGSVPVGDELLGTWMVPLGLLAGAMYAWLTTEAGIAGAVFLADPERGRSALWSPVEAAGRMALTNYIGQSLAWPSSRSRGGWASTGDTTDRPSAS